MSPGLGVALGVLLLLVNAFFVGAEFAVISARRSQIEPRAEAGSRAARTTLWAMEHLSLMLACAQLGITICSLGLLVITEPALHHLLEVPLHALGLSDAVVSTVAFAVALVVVGFLHVLAGEMIPKNISLSVPDRVALLLAPALVGVSKVVRPVIVVLNWAANGVLRLARVQPKDEVSSVYTLEEVRSLVDESQREGLVDDRGGMLAGSLTFAERVTADVLVPLADLVSVPEDVHPSQVEHLVARTGYSRFPVLRDGELLGYLHLQDVLYEEDAYDEPIPPGRVHRVGTVGDRDGTDDVLALMQRERVHLLGVVDADGALLGVVFFEDILEELVGEIRDAMQAER